MISILYTVYNYCGEICVIYFTNFLSGNGITLIINTNIFENLFVKHLTFEDNQLRYRLECTTLYKQMHLKENSKYNEREKAAQNNPKRVPESLNLNSPSHWETKSRVN